jgi:hypothetical protein
MDANKSEPSTTEALLKRLYASSSRRSFVMRCGRFILKVLGISLLPVLPIERNAEAQTECDGWYLCGIWGRLCQCSGCGGTYMSCPSCSSLGPSFWTECCMQSCIIYTVTYRDCCSNSQTCQSNCASCTFCRRGAQEPSWCHGYSYYVCTVAAIGGECE